MKLFNYLLQLKHDVRHVRTIAVLGALLSLSSTTAVAQWTTNGNNINNTNSGHVGVGTVSPSSRLTIVGPVQNGVYTVQIDSTAGGMAGSQHGILLIGTTATTYLTAGATTINGSAPHLNINGADNTNFTSTLGNTGGFGRVLRLRSSSGTTVPVLQVEGNAGGTVSLSALANGNVGIGTGSPSSKLHVLGDGTITGNLTVSGNLAAKYQDVAEWVESSQDLEPGTVVVIDSTKPNQVIASVQAYDSRVAGVISLQPGLTLGERGESRVLVATTGRVKVKVDARNGPIQIGDLLVTSEREGVAMKSVPLEIGGARIHRPGTLIGKALESLQTGTGEILVLLSLQ
jgi:hypothetical protein